MSSMTGVLNVLVDTVHCTVLDAYSVVEAADAMVGTTGKVFDLLSDTGSVSGAGIDLRTCTSQVDLLSVPMLFSSLSRLHAVSHIMTHIQPRCT